MNPNDHYHNSQFELFPPEEINPAGSPYVKPNPLEPNPFAYPQSPISPANPMNPPAPFSPLSPKHPMSQPHLSPTNDLIGQSIGQPPTYSGLPETGKEIMPGEISGNGGIGIDNANDIHPNVLPSQGNAFYENRPESGNLPFFPEPDQIDLFPDHLDNFDGGIDENIPFPDYEKAMNDKGRDDESAGEPEIEPFKPQDSHKEPSVSQQGTFSESSRKEKSNDERRTERLWNDSDHPDIPKARGRGQRSITKRRRKRSVYIPLPLPFRCARCKKKSATPLCRKCMNADSGNEIKKRCSECGYPVINGKCTNDECENSKMTCPECGEAIEHLPCPACGFE